MLDQLIWWGSIAVETLLLVRGLQTKLLSRYPAFYLYIVFVLSQSFLRLYVYHWKLFLYRYTYWSTEFVGILVGCGVVFEIFRVGLRAYPGASRMARNSLLLLFLLALVVAAGNAANDPRWWAEASITEIQRTMRMVQALSLFALVLLFLHYSIPFGRNLRGILFGYGLFVAGSVIWLTFAYTGSGHFRNSWFYLYPMSYDISLLVWIVHLWGYRPNPQTKESAQFERQYERIAAATKRRLQEARSYLDKAIDR
jgi:hypothetical protein